MKDTLSMLITSEEVVLLDGAMGTLLLEAGLKRGTPPEEWNVTRPEVVRSVHRRYLKAGARVILTNSLGSNLYRLKFHHMEGRGSEFNQAAAALARQEADAAPHPVVVAGSIGPTGELMEPMGLLTHEQAKLAYADQAEALADGGADVLWIETVSDLNEVKAAIEGARTTTNLPIAVTMTFDTHGRTMMGVSPAQALETMLPYDLIAMGANCGNGPAEIETAIAEMHKVNPSVTLIAKSNAGVPTWVDGQLMYEGTPEVMAAHAIRVRDLGAKLIGACCGSSPEHLRAMAMALDLPIPLNP